MADACQKISGTRVFREVEEPTQAEAEPWARLGATSTRAYPKRHSRVLIQTARWLETRQGYQRYGLAKEQLM